MIEFLGLSAVVSMCISIASFAGAGLYLMIDEVETKKYSNIAKYCILYSIVALAIAYAFITK